MQFLTCDTGFAFICPTRRKRPKKSSDLLAERCRIRLRLEEPPKRDGERFCTIRCSDNIRIPNSERRLRTSDTCSSICETFPSIDGLRCTPHASPSNATGNEASRWAERAAAQDERVIGVGRQFASSGNIGEKS